MAPYTPDPQAGTKVYANLEAGFSLTLPGDWEVSEITPSPLGRQFALAPRPLLPWAESNIIIADASPVTEEQALTSLCGPDYGQPEEVVLPGGARLKHAACFVAHPFMPRDDWYFTTHAGKLILFRIKDPVTRASLDGVVNSFTFLPEPGDDTRMAYQTTTAASIAAASRTSEPASGTPAAWETVKAGGTLSFEVQQDWLRVPPEPAWTPEKGRDLLLAVRWKDLQPGQEVEAAFLPSPAQMLDSTPVTLSWAARARRYLVEVFAPGATQGQIAAQEEHVVACLENRRCYDFYIHGKSAPDLVELRPALQHALDTARLGQ